MQMYTAAALSNCGSAACCTDGGPQGRSPNRAAFLIHQGVSPLRADAGIPGVPGAGDPEVSLNPNQTCKKQLPSLTKGARAWNRSGSESKIVTASRRQWTLAAGVPLARIPAKTFNLDLGSGYMRRTVRNQRPTAQNFGSAT